MPKSDKPGSKPRFNFEDGEVPSPKILAVKPEKSAKQIIDNLIQDKEKKEKIIHGLNHEIEKHLSWTAQTKIKLEKLIGYMIEELQKARKLDRIIKYLQQDQEDRLLCLRENQESGKSLEWQRKKFDFDPELSILKTIRIILRTSVFFSLDQKVAVAKAITSTGGKSIPKQLPEIEFLLNRVAKKILVVEDDPVTTKLICHFLEKEHYLVSHAFNSTDGFKKALKEKPDLILLDVIMPGMGGFQFLSRLKKYEELAAIPVIILSSLSQDTDIQKGLEIGAVDYLTKPFSPQVLLAKVAKVLKSVDEQLRNNSFLKF